MIKYLLMLSFLCPLMSLAQSTVAQAKTAHDNVWFDEEEPLKRNVRGGIGTRDGQAVSGHGGDMYYFSNAIDSHMYMLMATGEISYLEAWAVMVQQWIDLAVVSLTLPNTSIFTYTCGSYYGGCEDSPGGPAYYSQSYLTWENFGVSTMALSDQGERGTSQGYTSGGSAPLFESRGWRNIPTMLRILDLNPSLRATANGRGGTYQDDFDEILAFTETHVYEKWESRGLGNIYRNRTHMASHWALMSVFLYQITGNTKYQTMYQRFNTNMAAGGQTSSMRDQLRAHASATGGYVWNANWTLSTGATDLSHSNAEVEYMVLSFMAGEYWTQADMDALQITTKWLSDQAPNIPENIDGSGTTGNGLIEQGWVLLAAFDAATQISIENRSMAGSDSFDYEADYWARIAFARAYRDGTLVYDLATEGSSTDETPPVATLDAITFLSDTRFRARFLTDEPSQFSIEHGPSTGVYDSETQKEFNYLSSHNQYVGDNNGPPLSPGTTRYFRGKAIDQAGNIGYSIEYTQTTTGATPHFSPKIMSISGVATSVFFYDGQFRRF